MPATISPAVPPSGGHESSVVPRDSRLSGDYSSEISLIRALVRGPFRDAACLVPNVTYFGGEIDLLVIKPNKKLIDCEAKISRADLLADGKKQKWWRQEPWQYGCQRPKPTALEWPSAVWKHYYALPESVWDESLISRVKPMSGVLLIRENGSVRCRRPAKPSPTAKKISEKHLLAMCRLATLRMWDALGRGSNRLAEAA